MHTNFHECKPEKMNLFDVIRVHSCLRAEALWRASVSFVADCRFWDNMAAPVKGMRPFFIDGDR
jgi:hypothetical protein